MHSMKDRNFLALVLVLVYQIGFSQNFVIPPREFRVPATISVISKRDPLNYRLSCLAVAVTVT